MQSSVGSPKIPKQADKAIGLLEDLVEILHYFYQDHPNFRKDVLVPATKIEDILKELAINKKETFKRISKKYKDYYENKQVVDVTNVSDTNLNDRIKTKYKQNIKKDRK